MAPSIVAGSEPRNAPWVADRPRAGLDMPVEHVGIIGMPHRVVRGILLGEQAPAILLDRALRSAKSLQPRDFHRQARADRPFIDRMQFGRQHAQAALVFGIERLDRRFDLQDGAEALLTLQLLPDTAAHIGELIPADLADGVVADFLRGRGQHRRAQRLVAGRVDCLRRGVLRDRLPGSIGRYFSRPGHGLGAFRARGAKRSHPGAQRLQARAGIIARLKPRVGQAGNADPVLLCGDRRHFKPPIACWGTWPWAPPVMEVA